MVGVRRVKAALCIACEPRGRQGHPIGLMTPLERELAVLRRAEMAAHKFGTGFYPYTAALAAERAARPPIGEFCWSAGWLRPSHVELVTTLGLEGCDPDADTVRRPQERPGAEARTPPSVPESIIAVVKRQRLSPKPIGISRRPPPIIDTPARNVTCPHVTEEGVPRGEVAQTTHVIEEGIPPQGNPRRASASAAAVAAAAAAAS